MNIVHEYGLLGPREGAERVDEQLLLAHRYYNKLTEIERARRLAYVALVNTGEVERLNAEMAPIDATITALREQIKSLRSRKREKPEVVQEIAATRMKLNGTVLLIRTLREQRRAAQVALKEDGTLRTKVKDLDDEYAAQKRAARAACGVYWGTYLCVEASHYQACMAKPEMREDRPPPPWTERPHFRRWTGEGAVAAQMQGGLASPFGADTRVRIGAVDPRAWDPSTPRGERRRMQRTTLSLRIGSDDHGKPEWAKWPMIMHRPLPPGSQIMWVKVLRRKECGHDRWVVQFSLRCPEPAPSPSPHDIGIDLGWRKRGADLRVAYWADDSGLHGEVRVDATVLDLHRKAESLRSIRDRNMDALKDALAPLLAGVALPEDEFLSVAAWRQWRSPQKFAALLSRHVAALPNAAREALDAYIKRDRHLWRYETGVRKSALGRRREKARIWASRIATQYGVVYIEDFNLRNVATLPTPEARPDAADGGRDARERYQRVMGCPSEVRQILISAVRVRGGRVVKVPCEFTTMDCHLCGETNTWDHHELMHTCTRCGETWDQDENASWNILARGRVASETPDPLARPKLAKWHKKHCVAATPRVEQQVAGEDRSQSTAEAP